MNPNTDHETNLDRILLGEEEIIPSSGFQAATMERVRYEAAMPPPIHFPWKRAIPGIVLAAGTLGWSAWEAVHYALLDVQNLSLTVPTLSPAAARSLEDASWVALGLAASLCSWVLSVRLVRRPGLL